MSLGQRLVIDGTGAPYWTFASVAQALSSAQVGWGDCYTVSYHGLTIYAHCLTLEELAGNVRANGGGEDMVALEMAAARDNHRAGFRECVAYSTVVPEGETGSHHVSQCRKITEEQFEAARARGWRP